MFFKGSRYAKAATTEIVDSRGLTLKYKKVRFITQPRKMREQIVNEFDRLDNVAYKHLRDSQRFWRICDLNYALWPDDILSVAGRSIDIPVAED